MATTFKGIAVHLSANAAQFKTQMATASGAVRDFGNEATRASASATRSSAAAASALDGMGRRANVLRAAFAALAGSAAALGVAFGTKLAADLERTEVAFAAMLGSAEEADAFVRQLQQFAAETPFEFTGLTHATQTLLALGNTGDEALGVLRVIGDAVATIGGSPDAIDRVVRAMAQMQGKGRLAAEELNQIAEALPTVTRVAVYDVLAEKLSKTRAEVAALAETGQISADVGLAALLEVMSDLPGAAGAMERQSKTLAGVLSSLKDQLKIALAEGFGPLAVAIRDAVFPLLDALGALLRDTMTPLGAAMGDVFRGVAEAFAALAPHLPGIADAFGSLLSALAPLLPAAASLLDAVLVPLVPVLQAVAGALEFLLTSVPGVVGAIQALTVAFLALKAVALIQGIGGLATIVTGIGVAALGAQASVAGLAATARTLPAAFGPVGLAIAAVGTVMAIFKASATDAEESTLSFEDALLKTGEAADVASAKVIAAALADAKVVDVLSASGVPLRQVADAVVAFGKGAPDAANKLWAVRDAILGAAQAGTIGDDAANRLLDTITDLAFDADQSRQAVDQLGSAEQGLGIAGDDASAGQKALADTLRDMLDPLAAYEAAQKSATEAMDKRHQGEAQAMERRHDAERDALDDRLEMQAEAWEKEAAQRRDALDKLQAMELKSLQARHDAEEEALGERFDAAERAMEDRHRLEEQAWDDEVRTQKRGLDDKHRAERQALDASLALLDDAWDKRRRSEDRRWDTEKDEIQARIDSTFGAEREFWKAFLVEREDAHDSALDEMDHAQDAEKTTAENGLEDKQEAEDDALDDSLTAREAYFKKRQEDETKALTQEREDAKTAMGLRHEDEKASLGERHETLTTALTNQLDAEKAHNSDVEEEARRSQHQVQTDEDNALKARQSAQETAQGVSLASWKTHLDDKRKEAEQFNRDLALIASRGGADVLAEIAKLPPAVVDAAAKAGSDQLTALLESIRLGLAVAPPAPPAAGMPGGVTFGKRAGYAEGHFAQVAPPGSWRVWAEPETGGEAYIPLSAAKRSGSTAVLAATAHRFGYGLLPMANGGILGPSVPAGSGSSVVNNTWSPSVTVTAHVAAGVDPGAVGWAIRKEIDKAFDTLGRDIVMRGGRS